MNSDDYESVHSEDEDLSHEEEDLRERWLQSIGDLSSEDPLPEESRRSAVQLSEFLVGMLSTYGQLEPSDRRFNVFTINKSLAPEFRNQMKGFIEALLDAMHALPDSPGRKRPSKEEVNKLRGEFMRVDRSWRAMKSLMGIYSIVLERLGKVRPVSQLLHHVSAMEPYLKCCRAGWLMGARAGIVMGIKQPDHARAGA